MFCESFVFVAATDKSAESFISLAKFFLESIRIFDRRR